MGEAGLGQISAWLCRVLSKAVGRAASGLLGLHVRVQQVPTGLYASADGEEGAETEGWHWPPRA